MNQEACNRRRAAAAVTKRLGNDKKTRMQPFAVRVNS